MSSREVSFTALAGVPVHYDRGPHEYGTIGRPRSFDCTRRLLDELNACLTGLFGAWSLARPDVIMTAGTIGDGENAHGQGLAFDLDGFAFGTRIFTMDSYPRNREVYIGINAHLFLHFPQVLSYHYQGHRDHFHVDFNFTKRYRPESNAQTFFVQMVLKYILGLDIGRTGLERDGVDGIHGTGTRNAILAGIAALGLPAGTDLKTLPGWRAFLLAVRTRAFAGHSDVNP
jgi:hypothetical protein